MTTSLSSSLSTYLAESNWWTAERAQTQTQMFTKEEHNLANSAKLTKIITSAKDRPAISYYLHHVVSSLARLVMTVAIDIFVPPVGILYHASQALYHYKCTQISNQHWTCVKVELLRSTIVTLLVGIPILLSISASGAYPDLAQVVTSWILIPLAGIVAETLFFLSNPFLNSRRLDALSNDDQRIAKAILRWDLGYIGENTNYCKLLKSLIKESSRQMLNQIHFLQLLLPQEHRLPYDPTVNHINIGRILEYLEESREQLSKEAWEEVIPLRENLVKYHTIFERLQNHAKVVKVQFTFDPKDILNAYTNNESLTLPKRIPPTLRIRSFTQHVFIELLFSDFFYPSNYKPQEIKDEGSLTRSMEDVDIFACREKIINSFSNNVKKPLRWVARSLIGVPIMVTAAPAGTLFHGAKAAYYLGASILQGANLQFQNIQHAKAHAFAAWNDFISLFRGGFCGAALAPWDAIGLIASRDDCAGLSLSFILKNDFGVSGPNGKLLTFNSAEDVPPKNHFNAILFRMFEQTSLKILYQQHLEYLLLNTEAEKEALNKKFKHFCATGNGIAGTENLKILRDALFRVLEATDPYPGPNLGLDFTKMPHFAFEFTSFEGLLDQDGIDGIWLSQREIVKEKSISIENPSTPYEKLKNRIVENDATPRSVFEFVGKEPITSQAIETKYKTIALICHPDKIEAALQEEANEIFKFISETRKALLEIAKKPKLPIT